MTPIVRITVIVIAYTVAVFGGWLAMVLGEYIKVNGFEALQWLLSANAIKQLGLIVLLYAKPTLLGLALPLAAVIICVSEWRRWRSIFTYAFAGAMIAIVLQFRFSNTRIRDIGEFDHYRWRDLSVMAIAGLAAGLIYWAIAGHRAGRWRQPLVPASADQSGQNR